eukprot:GILI01032041.1.p1 GENE.GILI01032041.1~~GILI01032041.1.p1  ORF type:complete len:409 (+),score=101.24 GILI01032041.1:89-1228(+)
MFAVFCVAYFAGESRTFKKAAKQAELSNARLTSMRSRLDISTAERSSLTKGKASTESTAKTLERSRELLVKEIALLKETIREDVQAVHDCEAEAEMERKHRTGTTEKNPHEALQTLQATAERLAQQVEEANQTKGIRRAQMKRLVRAYALENRLLAKTLSATLVEAANRNRIQDLQEAQRAEAAADGEEADDGSDMPPKIIGDLRLPSRKELERLLMRAQRNATDQLMKDGNFDDEAAIANESAEDGQNAASGPKGSQSSKALSDLLDDMEEGLMVVDEMELPQEYKGAARPGVVRRARRVGANPNVPYVEKRKRGRAGMYNKNDVKPRARMPKTIEADAIASGSEKQTMVMATDVRIVPQPPRNKTGNTKPNAPDVPL